MRRTKIPDHVLSFIIKSFHFHTPIYGMFFFILAPLNYTYIFLVNLTLCLSIFFYLKGCFLTQLEYKLVNKEFINIIDVFIYYYGDEPTEENRRIYTLKIAYIYFVIIFFILLIRYKFNL